MEIRYQRASKEPLITFHVRKASSSDLNQYYFAIVVIPSSDLRIYPPASSRWTAGAFPVICHDWDGRQQRASFDLIDPRRPPMYARSSAAFMLPRYATIMHYSFPGVDADLQNKTHPSRAGVLLSLTFYSSFSTTAGALIVGVLLRVNSRPSPPCGMSVMLS